jgi:hypothetical protein
MDEENPTTVKIKGITQINEKEYAQAQYDEALQAMIDNPSQETIKAFGIANQKLFEVEDAYRIGARLLLERVRADIIGRRIYKAYNENQSYSNRR